MTERAVNLDERWRDVKSLLAVRLDNLGDVLLCTPAIRAIKRALPEARITLLAGRVGAQVAELNPDVDEAIVYEAPWMDVWQRQPLNSAREQEVIALIKQRRFDAAVIFTSFRQSSLPAAYLCYLADIPLRLAISTDGSGSLLTTRHRPPELPIVHEVQRGLDLVGAVGFRAEADDLVLEVGERLRLAAKERLAAEGVDSGRPLAAVHPGCSMPARTYPWEGYAEIADLLIERLGCQVVFTGSVDEIDLVERIQGRMAAGALSWAGRTSFRELAALIAVADVLVTNNTGPQHIAAAVKTPVAVLFALTNPPWQWGPWRVPHRLLYRDVPCGMCYSRVCPTDHGCLKGVTPAEVVENVCALLEEARRC